MNSCNWFWIISLLVALCRLELSSLAEVPTAPTCDELVTCGRAFLQEGRLDEAYIAALEASKTDRKRFEPYVLAALALARANNANDALKFLKQALVLAPASKQAKLLELQQSLQSEAHAAQQQQPRSLEQELANALDANGTMKEKFRPSTDQAVEQVRTKFDDARLRIRDQNAKSIQESERQIEQMSRERQMFAEKVGSLPGAGANTGPTPGPANNPGLGSQASPMDCSYYQQRAQQCRQSAQEARANAAALRSNGPVLPGKNPGGSMADSYLAAARAYEKAATDYEGQYRQCQGRPR